MTTRERAVEQVAQTLRTEMPAKRAESVASDVLDDLSSGQLDLVERWETENLYASVQKAMALVRTLLNEFHAFGGFSGDTPTMRAETSVGQVRDWLNELATIEREVQS